MQRASGKKHRARKGRKTLRGQLGKDSTGPKSDAIRLLIPGGGLAFHLRKGD